MAKRIQVTVTVGDRKVTIEGPEGFVRDEVERLTRGGEKGVGVIASQDKQPSQTERDFVVEKKPSGHAETVAVLAFCLRQADVSEFTPDDMRRAYIRAGVRPPKVIAQALRDAKNKYDFIEPGSQRGTFRLSPHGERTVLFDLPRA